jgi:hypothetical protein
MAKPSAIWGAAGVPAEAQLGAPGSVPHDPRSSGPLAALLAARTITWLPERLLRGSAVHPHGVGGPPPTFRITGVELGCLD